MVWPEQNRLTMLDSGPVALAATLTPKQAANRKWSESAAPAVCAQTHTRTHTHTPRVTYPHTFAAQRQWLSAVDNECCG